MNEILIQLDKQKALVLFDWIGKNNSLDQEKIIENIMWEIESSLESQLVEVLDPDYNRLVTEAKESLLKKYDI